MWKKEVFYCWVLVLRSFSSSRVNRNLPYFQQKLKSPQNIQQISSSPVWSFQDKTYHKITHLWIHTNRWNKQRCRFPKEVLPSLPPWATAWSAQSVRGRHTFKYCVISRNELWLNCCNMDILGYKQFKTFYLLKAQTGKSEWHKVKIVILKKSCNLYLIQTPHAL